MRSIAGTDLLPETGSAFPTAPVIGMLFLHTPTGRKILYQYDGANWQPIQSYGTMTLYVDSTDGTDDLNHGTGVDAAAFKTIQYAYNTIPAVITGIVTININGETYNESLVISDRAAHGYYIILQGTLSQIATGIMTSAVQGVGATQGSITKAGGFGAYDNKLIYANSEYRIIDSDTANTATIVGCWSALPSGTYTVYDWATKITGARCITADCTKVPVYFRDIEFNGSDNGEALILYSELWFERCKFHSYVGAEVNSVVEMRFCLFLNAVDKIYCTTGSFMEFFLSKVTNPVAFSWGIYVHSNAIVYFEAGSIIDGQAQASNTGMVVYFGGQVIFDPTWDGYGYPRIRNLATGIVAATHGCVTSTVNVQYSGNGANESATAASFGYID